jgi:DNA-binding MarR family transcriptional regulator
MESRMLEKVTDDLLSIPPIIFRIIRNKFIRAALTDIGADITPNQFEVIRLLMEHGTLHVTDIGQHLEIARAQMTHLIDHLVDLNIVERQPDAYDRRTTNITLTSHGRKLLDEHWNVVQNAVSETMSVLSEKELNDLSDSLRKLRDMLVRLE